MRRRSVAPHPDRALAGRLARVALPGDVVLELLDDELLLGDGALTRSPIETRPISRPPSITGKWRSRCSVISAMHSSLVWSGVHIHHRAGHDVAQRRVLRGPCHEHDLARVVAFGDDADDLAPSITRSAPMFLSAISSRASNTEAVGPGVWTVWAGLDLRIWAAVFMYPPLGIVGVRGRRSRSPERRAQALGEGREHHVEADADSFLVTRVGIDRMLR